MKAISLWQPWALAWLLTDPDEKRFETRSWYTSYRGPLLIHAAKKTDGEVMDYLVSRFFLATLERHGLKESDVRFGAIIGRVDLIGCSRMDQMPPPTEREKSWGNWEPNRFAWERGPKTEIFDSPIPYRGQQGFFDVELL